MKVIASQSEVSLCMIPQHSDYPFEESIINIDVITAGVLVSWQFPNHQFVQLVFHPDQSAEIFHMSSAIILPEEGDNGKFYTQSEVKLFLFRIKNFA